MPLHFHFELITLENHQGHKIFRLLAKFNVQARAKQHSAHVNLKEFPSRFYQLKKNIRSIQASFILRTGHHIINSKPSAENIFGR